MDREFVPYDLALKLKALGFNKPCFGWYEKNSNFYYCYQEGLIPPKPSKRLIKGCCLAPTWDQVEQFFEKDGYFFSLCTDFDDISRGTIAFWFEIFKNNKFVYESDFIYDKSKQEVKILMFEKIIENYG